MAYPLQPIKDMVAALARVITGDGITGIPDLVQPYVAKRDEAPTIMARADALSGRLTELVTDLKAIEAWPSQASAIEGRLQDDFYRLDQALGQAGTVLRELTEIAVDARRGRKQSDGFRHCEAALQDAIKLKEKADEELKTIMIIKENENRRDPSNAYGAANDPLVNAVSRLQGGGAGWGGSGSSQPIGDFDKLISNRLGVTLGLPDLQGETARSQNAGELLEKLRAGLDRTVLCEDEGGEIRWKYDPLRARGRGEIAASVSGAQGVVLRNLRALRTPFVQALHDIGSERHRGDWDEGDELRAAAEQGFDMLISEASQPTGPYLPAVDAAARQVAMDVMNLAALGDVIETVYRYEFTQDMHLADSAFDGDTTDPADVPHPDAENPDWAFWRTLLDYGERDAISRLIVPQDSPAEVATRDPDLGLLDAEANEAALVSVLGHVRSAYMLLTRDLGQGARLGRIRLRNDALAAAAGQAETALAAVGLSSADLSAMGAGNASDGVIDVSRLLRWIADTAQGDRAMLARDDVSQADLRRILRVRQAQFQPLDELVETELPGVPLNRFSAGRRELVEMRAQLDGLINDLTTFVPHSGTNG